MRRSPVLLLVVLLLAPLVAAPARAAPKDAASKGEAGKDDVLEAALKGLKLPLVDSTDALDKTLPAVVVAEDGVALGQGSDPSSPLVFSTRGAGDDAHAAGLKRLQGELAATVKAQDATSVALFVDERARAGLVSEAVRAAGRAGVSSFSLVVNGLRAVRAAAPPRCEADDLLEDRCAEVTIDLGADGAVVTAHDLDVGLEACEPTKRGKPKGARAKWSGKPLLSEGETCPTVPAKDGALDDAAVRSTYKTLTSKVGDCSRVRLTFADDVRWKDALFLARQLRASGVESLSLAEAAKGPRCRDAVAMSALDAGLPAGRKLVVQGDLQPADVRAAVDARRDALEGCWKKHGRRGGQGALVASLVVSAEGAVEIANVVDSDLGLPKLDACVVDVLKGATLPRSATGAPSTVTYPLVFGAR